MQLFFLKAQMQRTNGKRRKSRAHGCRRSRLRSKHSKMLNRLRSRLRRAMGKHRHMQRSAASRWGDSTGQDYSFLSDPRLSTAEKLQRLLIELSSKYDQKAEQLMKRLSDASNKKKSTGQKITDFFKKVMTVVGGCVAGPAGVAAAKGIGSAIDGATGAKGGKENEKVLEFELQRIMQRANQLFSMASQLQKNEHDTAKGIIGRMAV